ncbi:hypothetical protein SDJN02_20360, partial [Cucurbita argyrosperma subsp. argyrosperma]
MDTATVRHFLPHPLTPDRHNRRLSSPKPQRLFTTISCFNGRRRTRWKNKLQTISITRTPRVPSSSFSSERNFQIAIDIDKVTAEVSFFFYYIYYLSRSKVRRTSGVKVSFNTENMCDSFYRASVDFVLNIYSRTPVPPNSVLINGEDGPNFVAGLAEDIGIENVRAARIVSAAVAARMRSCFLQAWALVMQDRQSEANAELLKICYIIQIFPPEESSFNMYGFRMRDENLVLPPNVGN